MWITQVITSEQGFQLSKAKEKEGTADDLNHGIAFELCNVEHTIPILIKPLVSADLAGSMQKELTQNVHWYL